LKLNSLFIDIVNTASRIETSSEKQKVQISEMTKQLLNADEWDIYERGIVQLKGKGLINFELNF
jgi:class 3 adenylate cyclase